MSWGCGGWSLPYDTGYRLFHVLVQKLHLILKLLYRLTKIPRFPKWVEYRVQDNFDPPLDPPLVNKNKLK